MLSPQLRNQVHNLWTLFWSAGMTNPLVAIEQITYLLFLRQLERLDDERVKVGKPSIYYRFQREIGYEENSERPITTQVDHDRCRWSYIRQNVSFALLNDTVFPWLRGLEKWLAAQPATSDDKLRQVTGRLDDAYFVLDPNKTDTLTRAVQAIDELFRQLDSRSANADIMGDIFEHLLGEIESSGKNGQFRTPRHVIRFMVQLLDPPVGAKILDPACGTGGFLVNTLLHWRAKTTDPETLRLEWDGTPHRAFGDGTVEKLPLDACFTGYDNDRTMVRIGWMNLILHGLEFPHIEQRDSLSKRMPDEESNTYDFILANPPFTGSVDEGDLSPNRQRFPAGKANKPITTKSELLFVWLLLDLLKVGGRAAVVVPDGVLFGSTNAHRELRRQLLFEHTLEGVVSLPAGVFLPYAGVKTSILVFQKASEKATPGADPRTREVWFYEVEDEAYTLDQKRRDRPGQDNDLWDALEKFKAWREWQHAEYPKAFAKKREAHRAEAVGDSYFQPLYFKERWRAVDREFLAAFPEHNTQEGHVLSLNKDLFGSPEIQLEQHARPKLWAFLRERLCHTLRQAADDMTPDAWRAAAPKLCETVFREFNNHATRLVRDEGLLDREFDQFGWNALQQELGKLKTEFLGNLPGLLQGAEELVKAEVGPWPEIQAPLRDLLREFAKLDGYDVWRRGNEALREEGKRINLPGGGFRREPVQLSWAVLVRAWASLEAWGEDPKTKQAIKEPTHDANGLARPEYLKWLRDSLKVFDTDGTVKEEFRERLDPACIEAAEFNLSASRHKPFTFEAGQHRPPAEVIRELDGIHGEIRSKLGKLLAMVEGKE
jgi:type I restriction enzyme M protein